MTEIASQATQTPLRHVIRTPDQRLRVFISSTLQELLPEREAAKAAVRRLHLSPVLFELGARPHPPRELYRAYLDQSHIFVGIYWQRYGWVAPGEAVSGLEDEYQLSGNRPKLIYVKKPTTGREPRLDTLLDEIRSDDMASYKSFADAAELQRLLLDDLALLLTERFEASMVASASMIVPPPTTAKTESNEPTATPTTRREPWPHTPTPLIGRDAELAQLETMLADPEVSLITLLGPGGIGKSRLALAVGERTALPAIFVDLAPLSDPDLVMSTIADALDVPESEGSSRTESLLARLGGCASLIVLDNMEHLVDAADDVSALLAACGQLKIVATSRTPLRIGAEFEFPVPPLAEQAAVELFVERAQAVKPSFTLTVQNSDAVSELIRRLDGLPLALELAAARAKLLAPAQLLRRLDRRFELLSGGDRDLPDRQQTLRRTIDWSYNLLESPERLALTELSVFAGGWSLSAAEAVCSAPGDDRPSGAATDSPDPTQFLDQLARLVDDSLVVAYDVGGESRFRLLESIRAYALEKLDGGGQAEAVRARHADYFGALAEQARGGLTGSDQRLWLGRLDLDHDNLRAALAWLAGRPDPEPFARLASSLIRWWWIRGYYAEGTDWLLQARDKISADDPLSPRVLEGLGVLAWVQGDYGAAEQHYQESLEVSRRIGNEASTASSLGNLGIIAIERGDLAKAQSLVEEMLQMCRDQGDESGAAAALINLSLVLTRRNEIGTARSHLEEALTTYRQLGNGWGVITALINLGEIWMLEGDQTKAAGFLTESLQMARDNGDNESIAYSLESLGSVAVALGDLARAARLWGAGDGVRTAIGNPRPPSSGATTYEADVAAARERLGPAEFTRAWDAGRAAAVDSVIDEVLASSPPG